MTCAICGAENYAPSLGGPDICPSCDCGQFDGRALALRNSRLAAEVKELRAALTAPPPNPDRDKLREGIARKAWAWRSERLGGPYDLAAGTLARADVDQFAADVLALTPAHLEAQGVQELKWAAESVLCLIEQDENGPWDRLSRALAAVGEQPAVELVGMPVDPGSCEGDDSGWILAFFHGLHAHLPEDERPTSWMQFSDDQRDRIKSAYRAMVSTRLAAVGSPNPQQAFSPVASRSASPLVSPPPSIESGCEPLKEKLLRYWQAGATIIEACLAKATTANHADAPFPYDEAQARIWHAAQFEAYRHSLEMMGPPDPASYSRHPEGPVP